MPRLDDLKCDPASEYCCRPETLNNKVFRGPRSDGYYHYAESKKVFKWAEANYQPATFLQWTETGVQVYRSGSDDDDFWVRQWSDSRWRKDLMATTNQGLYLWTLGHQQNEQRHRNILGDLTGGWSFVFVAGVNNPLLGETWNRETDDMLIALGSYINRWWPEFDPKYLYLIDNDNGGGGGIRGASDTESIDAMRDILIDAYLHGLSLVRVSSHSNGCITFNQGLKEFGDWVEEYHRKNRRKEGVLTIEYDGYQNACDERADFAPLTLSRYNGAEGVKVRFRYYYNSNDELTYWSASTVGARASRGWVTDAYARGIYAEQREAADGYHCVWSIPESCVGPAHNQELIHLWWAAAGDQTTNHYNLVHGGSLSQSYW